MVILPIRRLLFIFAPANSDILNDFTIQKVSILLTLTSFLLMMHSDAQVVDANTSQTKTKGDNSHFLNTIITSIKKTDRIKHFIWHQRAINSIGGNDTIFVTF